MHILKSFVNFFILCIKSASFLSAWFISPHSVAVVKAITCLYDYRSQGIVIMAHFNILLVVCYFDGYPIE